MDVHHRPWRSLFALIAILVTVTAGPFATQPARSAEPVDYVGLGDSFAAGAGNFPLAEGAGPLCLQYTRNFARLVAADLGYRLTDASCAAADTADFRRPQYPGVAPQLDAVGPNTDVVTVMIGGNDNSIYGGLARLCAMAFVTDGAAGTPCLDRLSGEPPAIEAIEPNLVNVLAEIRARAPHAAIYAVGYPRLLPDSGGCAPTVPFAGGDIPFLDEVEVRLNDTIRRATEQVGATFVDMSEVSVGRDACAPADHRWIDPPIGAHELALLHPNVAGQQAIADRVREAILAG